MRLLQCTLDAGLVKAHYQCQEAEDRLEIAEKERQLMLASRRAETKNAAQLQVRRKGSPQGRRAGMRREGRVSHE